MEIRPLRNQDRVDVTKLYRLVAGSVQGIARRPEEITDTWIFSLMNKPDGHLVGIVAVIEDDQGDEEIIGIAHAEKIGLKCYNHILQDFTIIVHPHHQKKGIGRQLGFAFLMHVAKSNPDVKRLEMEVKKDLMHHETYMKAGFIKEGEIQSRIRNTDGSFSDSILLVWLNPNFKS